MRILVTGSDGFTGSRYCQMAPKEGHEALGIDVKNDFTPKGCRVEALDIRDEQACKKICGTFKPDAVIHTARAPGNLWHIEKDRETAFEINVRGTMNLARCAEEMGAIFVFLSTDWVFGGGKPLGQKYFETEDGRPLNYYGVTKWIAEQEIMKLKSRWLILRPAHIYGFHAGVSPTKERTGLLEGSVWAHMGRAIQRGERVRVPDNMYQTPVEVIHLVEITMDLLKKGLTGIYHLADRDCVSRYRIAKTVLEAIGFDGGWIEKGVAEDFGRSQGFPEALFGVLPANTCLNVHKIEKALGRRMLTFEEGVARMIADFRY